jgi:hypothetical protein
MTMQTSWHQVRILRRIHTSMVQAAEGRGPQGRDRHVVNMLMWSMNMCFTHLQWPLGCFLTHPPSTPGCHTHHNPHRRDQQAAAVQHPATASSPVSSSSSSRSGHPRAGSHPRRPAVLHPVCRPHPCTCRRAAVC